MTIATPAGAGTSPFDTSVAPITASDDEIRAHLAEAEVPPLLPALAYATGDLSLLRDDLRPDPSMVALPQGGLGEDQLAAARELAAQALIRFRDGGSTPAPPPADDVLLRIMEHAVGGAEMADYLPLLEEELAYRGEDRRAPGWHKRRRGARRRLPRRRHRRRDVRPARGPPAAQAGVDFVILEKNDDVGGTWFENTYPGCRVDNPNHNYSYSFAQRHDWPLHFSTQDVLLDYFRHCADDFGLRPHIRFGTEVLSAAWSEADAHWTLRVRSGGGDEETLDRGRRRQRRGPAQPAAVPDRHRGLRVVRRARRSTPPAGTTTSTSRASGWRSSAPAPAPCSSCPRSRRWPASCWCSSARRPGSPRRPTTTTRCRPGLRWLYAARALLQRVATASGSSGGWATARCEGVARRPGVGAEGPGGERGERLRPACCSPPTCRSSSRTGPTCCEAVLPTYPVGRQADPARQRRSGPGRSSATTSRLVTGGIERDHPERGRHRRRRRARGRRADLRHRVHRPRRSSRPCGSTGRDGVDLHEQWGGDARAYLGVTVPGFPNLFCLYGPNTNIVVNGSIVYFSECGVRYILGCLRPAAARARKRRLDVRREVHDEFNERVDAENRRDGVGLVRRQQLVQERAAAG